MQSMKFNSGNNLDSGSGTQSEISNAAGKAGNIVRKSAKKVGPGLKKTKSLGSILLGGVNIKAVALAAIFLFGSFVLVVISASPISIWLKGKDDMINMSDKITDKLGDAYLDAQDEHLSDITNKIHDMYGCADDYEYRETYPIDWVTKRRSSSRTGAYAYVVQPDKEHGGKACYITFRFENPKIDTYGNEDADTDRTSVTNLVYSYALAANQTISSYSNLIEEVKNSDDSDDSDSDSSSDGGATMPDMNDQDYEAMDPKENVFEETTGKNGKTDIKVTDYAQGLIDSSEEKMPDATNKQTLKWLKANKSDYFYTAWDYPESWTTYDATYQVKIKDTNYDNASVGWLYIPEYVDMTEYRADDIDEIISDIKKYGVCDVDDADGSGSESSSCTKTEFKIAFWKTVAENYNNAISQFVPCDEDKTSKTYGYCDFTSDYIFVKNTIKKGVPSTDPRVKKRTRRKKAYSGAVNMSNVQNEPENAKKIYEYLYKHGYNMIQICAILGNIQAESGFDPSAVNSIGASGICQWLGGRLDNLARKATSEGKSWQDLDVQLEYLCEELNGSGWTAGYKEKFMSATSIEAATEAFVRGFERPGNYQKEVATRTGYAKAHLANFQAAAIATTDVVLPSADGAVGKAMAWAVQTAEDDSHGYSQANRLGNPDYDCSSLMSSAWRAAGVNVPISNTSIMPSWVQYGFAAIPFTSEANLQPGDVLLASGHTEMYLGNGKNVGAHSAENGTAFGNGGDQTDDHNSSTFNGEVSVTPFWNDGWYLVLRYSG